MRPTGHNAVEGCQEYNPIHEPMIACCIVVEVVASAASLFLCTHVHLKQ